MSQTNSIPASQIVSVRPNVLSAGGKALAIIGLLLTTSTRVPIGQIVSFADAADVAAYFGSVSPEASAANIYFDGFDGSNLTPDSLLVAQYPATAVSAYVRGGNISGVPLNTLKAYTGSLGFVMDGLAYSAASVNLSAATSQSSAATIIATAINAALPNASTFTASMATTVMTVTAQASGSIQPGQVVAGGTTAANTKVVNQLTSTETDGHLGGKGTYTVSISQTVTSGTLTTTAALVVTYDSQSGAFIVTSGTTGAASTAAFATGTIAANLLLTSATGAVLSQGAAATDPQTFMNNLVLTTQNWVSFMTVFDPDNGSGNAQKLLFAEWNSAQDDEYAYIAWDTDVTPTTTVPATTSLGYLLAQAEIDGTFLIWAPSFDKAAFAAGIGASIDFAAANGRTTYKFRTQDGLVPDVTNATVASNLAANGYNFYGGYATRSQNFNFLANGVVSGKFDWMDTYINQIQLNNALQEAILLGLTQAKSIPYNSKGYALVEAWCMDPINAALNFGSIQPGVTLSAAQVQEVNQDAGANIASVLSTRGWYLQVQDASPQVRANRQSPPCTLWYMDGGSIQQIDLDSIAVQ